MTAASGRAQLGPSLLAATLASALLGLPFAFTAGGAVLSSWLIGAASAAFLLGPATLGVNRVRSFREQMFWPGAGLLLSLAPLTTFGGLIKTATHHRPLGAATFAVVACLVVAFAVLFCWRAGAIARSLPEARGRLIRSVVGGAALLSGAWSLLGLSKLGASRDLVIGSIELCLAALALWFASTPKTQERLAKLPGAVGVAIWIALVSAGAILAMSMDPQAARGPSTAILWLLFAP